MPLTLDQIIENLDACYLPSLNLVDRKALPKIPCVYIVRSAKQVMYVGQAKNLFNRWVTHHQMYNLKSLPEVSISWLEIEDINTLDEVERSLIQRLRPLLNVTHNPIAYRRLKTKDKSLTLRLTQKQYDGAERLAKERDITLSEVFRFLFHTYLSTH